MSIETAAARLGTTNLDEVGREGTVEVPEIQTGVVEELSSVSGRTVLATLDGRW